MPRKNNKTIKEPAQWDSIETGCFSVEKLKSDTNDTEIKYKLYLNRYLPHTLDKEQLLNLHSILGAVVNMEGFD